MARIAGVDLPKEKRLETALTYIFGIGRTLSREVIEKAQVNPDTRVKDLTNEEIGRIRNVLGDYKVEGALRTEIAMNIKRLMDIGCYRGIRHRRGLPVRGQRTHTNARTRTGRRRTVIGAKKAKAKSS
ncbi:MAG: 30S ribosomal protein S13 [candidate division KSB1 bacterium]|nr:30S ribosomal protein S13 [candidate division KSB1 bacterium]MDZ7334643.1 30S ribosomal protein S13 [candidate division KSB1 bacterium]MDZ7357206.1 30S ribosomal protein S13 [candidate division KSB1 bacterium]MDZ7399458.1 30S ribosomal protein S13 [candidate division KSB1 bacterium]